MPKAKDYLPELLTRVEGRAAMSMSTGLQTKLERIKAACRKAIESGSQWKVVHEKGNGAGWSIWGGRAIITDSETCRHNPEEIVIAHARTLAPAAAQATLTAIGIIQTQRVRFDLEKFQPGVDAMTEGLQRIASEWPEEP